MKTKIQELFTILVIAVLVLSLIHIDEVKAGVAQAIENCLIGIVPSLFLNSVLSSVLIKLSGAIKPKKISRGSYGIFLAFILGNICGYPIGAKILDDLVKEKAITCNQAEIAICFSFASGPAYILGTVSASVFSEKLLGFTAFTSIFLSNMVLYIVCTIKLKFKSDTSISCKGFSLTDAVMNAISSSAGSMTSICSAIVFFSAIIALLPSMNPIIYAVLEISNITSLEGSGMLFFVMITVLLSFGGLCVHMQILCMSDGSFSFKRFYLTRPIQLLLTAAFSSIGYLIIQNHISIDADASKNIVFSSTGSIVPFICVCGMVLIALTYKKSDRM